MCSICVCLGDATNEALVQHSVMELVTLPKGAPLLNQRSLQKGRTLRVCFRVHLSQLHTEHLRTFIQFAGIGEDVVVSGCFSRQPGGYLMFTPKETLRKL